MEAPELCKVVLVVVSLPDGCAFLFGSLESQKKAYFAVFLPDSQLTPVLSCDSVFDCSFLQDCGCRKVFASDSSSACMDGHDMERCGDGWMDDCLVAVTRLGKVARDNGGGRGVAHFGAALRMLVHLQA